jgi:hypothetical protein
VLGGEVVDEVSFGCGPFAGEPVSGKRADLQRGEPVQRGDGAGAGGADDGRVLQGERAEAAGGGDGGRDGDGVLRARARRQRQADPGHDDREEAAGVGAEDISVRPDGEHADVPARDVRGGREEGHVQDHRQLRWNPGADALFWKEHLLRLFR